MILVSIALAQAIPDSDNIDVPTLDADLLHRALATRGTFVTEDAGRIRDAPVAGFQLGMGYANAPLVVSWDAGGSREQASVLRDALVFDAIATLEYDRLRLGLDIPVYALATSDVGVGGAGLGNVALDARLTALDPTEADFGLAFVGRLDLPSPDADRALASPRVGYELAAVGEKGFGDATLAVNLGYRGVPRADLYNVVWNDLLFARLAGTYAIDEQSGVSLEAVGSVITPSSDDVLGEARGAPTPVEVLGGGWFTPVSGFSVRGAIGTGVTTGIGSPRFRGLLDFVWTPELAVKDLDVDGVSDRNDQCPSDAEDADGFQDDDGCPDPDNDGDGVLDADDECPDQGEDTDEFQDDDGCPDPSQKILIRVVDDRNSPVGGAILQVSGDGLEPTSNKELDLHPGTYKVVAFAGGFKPAQLDLEVTGGKDRVFQVVLQRPEPGVARVELRAPAGTVPAGLSVKFGDRNVRTANGVAEIQLPSGKVEVRVPATDQLAAFLGRMTLKGGETTTLVVPLGPPGARIVGDRLRISKRITFTEEGAVAAENAMILHQVAAIIDDNPRYRVRIGDTAGGEGAETRAKAVQKWLVDNGIASDRLEVDPASRTDFKLLED